MKGNWNYPLVFDIARGSFVDGPGIRTVVFLKGCPLRCAWCQNPESQKMKREVMFFPEYCIKCGNCRTHGLGCDALARRVVGEYYTPSQLAEIIFRDDMFFQTSGGGVTFSGGEPLLFSGYLLEVASILKRKKIHIAIETSGYFDYSSFKTGLLGLTDLVFFDIKLMDPVEHKRYTGRSNKLIFNNLLDLITEKVEVITRTPIIPGTTDAMANLAQLTEFLNEHEIKNHIFLPYNAMGTEKRKRLRTMEIFDKEV